MPRRDRQRGDKRGDTVNARVRKAWRRSFYRTMNVVFLLPINHAIASGEEPEEGNESSETEYYEDSPF